MFLIVWLRTMVLISHGSPEKGAHIRNNLCHLIRLRHLVRSRAVTDWIFFFPKELSSFMRAQHILSYYLIWVVVQSFKFSYSAQNSESQHPMYHNYSTKYSKPKKLKKKYVKTLSWNALLRCLLSFCQEQFSIRYISNVRKKNKSMKNSKVQVY